MDSLKVIDGLDSENSFDLVLMFIRTNNEDLNFSSVYHLHWLSKSPHRTSRRTALISLIQFRNNETKILSHLFTKKKLVYYSFFGFAQTISMFLQGI